MAATSHPDATLAAMDCLRDGGSAVDAAICAGALLAVVEPAETGIGGDCFALVAPHGAGLPVAFNGSGRAPAGADPEPLRARGLAHPEPESAEAVTIPGAIDAWCQLHERFGRLDFARLLAPAIRAAEAGFVVHERVALEWHRGADRLRRAPAFLSGGVPPRAGDRVRNPALAATLRTIAERGRAGFYEGPVAEAMVAALNERGGAHRAEDFAAHMGEFVDPISAPFRGRRIWQLPPNTPGATALAMLRLHERFAPEAGGFLSPAFAHRAIEIERLANAAQAALLGDPGHSGGMLDFLADEARLDEMAISIDPAHAMSPRVAQASAHTTCLSVVDRDGSMVSFINSIFHSFGSGICPDGTGILLQNRGAGFHLEAGHPGVLGPGRRPPHTLIPGMIGEDDAITGTFGVMGGPYQPMGHAHVLTAMLDYAMDPQAACDAPRYLPVAEGVEVEDSVPQSLRDGLASLGHRLLPAAEPLGGAQIVLVDRARGLLVGGSDPRKDGLALGR